MKTGIENMTRAELSRMSRQAEAMLRVATDVPIGTRIHVAWYHAAGALAALVELEHRRRTFQAVAGLEAWR
jgi:hypothetical protein